MKAIYNSSESEYKKLLDYESSQLASKISEYCILDFCKDENTLYEILTYIKKTHHSVFAKVVPMLNFAKMKEEKLRMLKDDRFGVWNKKKFHGMLDILIEFSSEKDIAELNSIKKLK